MDKQQSRIALAVLDAAKGKFPETKKFVDDVMEDECQKRKIICRGGGNFLISLEANSSEKYFLFCSEYVKRYCIKLNLFG